MCHILNSIVHDPLCMACVGITSKVAEKSKMAMSTCVFLSWALSNLNFPRQRWATEHADRDIFLSINTERRQPLCSEIKEIVVVNITHIGDTMYAGM